MNAAGLWAAEVARSIRGFPRRLVPGLYPVPVDGGLGVHVTLDIQGTARFGPDVSWVESVDYGFDESRKGAFVEAVRRYWPALDAEKLSAGYTGIRPKLGGPGTAAADFVVQVPGEHGMPGLVNLFGIESPGLTAALPLADLVCASV